MDQSHPDLSGTSSFAISRSEDSDSTSPGLQLSLKCQRRSENSRDIGKQLLYSWTSAPLNLDQFGWYRGTVAKVASAADQRKGLTYEVTYRNSETNDSLPFAFGGKRLGASGASAKIPLKLARDNWGVTKQWVVLTKSDGSTSSAS